MTGVSRCMHYALRIATLPRAQWQGEIAKVREACPESDCSAGVGCRERVADYLRVQWRMLAAREARQQDQRDARVGAR